MRLFRFVVAVILGAVLVFVLLDQITSAQSSCTSGRTANTGAEASVIQQVNQLRAQHGLRALTPTAALTRAADSHSLQMAATGVFAHDTYAMTAQRLQGCGNPAPSLDEAIAGGNADPTATYQQWLNSPPHLAIMLDNSMIAIGVAQEVGIYTAGGTTYSGFSMWTLEASSSLDTAQPPPQPTPTPSPQPTPAPQSMVCATALRAPVIQLYPC